VSHQWTTTFQRTANSSQGWPIDPPAPFYSQDKSSRRSLRITPKVASEKRQSRIVIELRKVANAVIPHAGQRHYLVVVSLPNLPSPKVMVQNPTPSTPAPERAQVAFSASLTLFFGRQGLLMMYPDIRRRLVRLIRSVRQADCDLA